MFPFIEKDIAITYTNCVPFDPTSKIPFVGKAYRQPIVPGVTNTSWCYTGSSEYSGTTISKQLEWGFCYRVGTLSPARPTKLPTFKGGKTPSPSIQPTSASPTHKGFKTPSPSNKRLCHLSPTKSSAKSLWWAPMVGPMNRRVSIGIGPIGL